jgi:hypothetical protein
LSKSIYKNNGDIRTFGEQLFLMKQGALKSSDLLIVSKRIMLPFKELNNNLPLVISQTNAQKVIKNKHNIPVEAIEDILEFIENSALALESKKHNILIFLDKEIKNPPMERNQSLFLTEGGLMRVNIPPNNKNVKLNMMIIFKLNIVKHLINVNEIRSIYYDSVNDEIQNTLNHNGKVYTNNKTNDWLKNIGILKHF